jgi:pyridoxal phosphate enzyme (YggS family)
MAAACARSGRPSDAVRLVAVTKTVPAEHVREVLALGVRDLGENRVQEAEGKIAALGRAAARWHLVGHLQANKAARAVALFDVFHGLDNERLAERLSRLALAAGARMPVLVEVNVAGEASKFGIAPEALDPLLRAAARQPGLEVQGLMTVGPQVARPQDARPGFAALRALRDGAERRLGMRLPELSMGMSDDFEVAIEEGSTLVRIGRALFGERP